jgi:hypothetical protein
MTNKRTVFIIGGPDAGKTNYLIRLWLSIHRGRGLITPVGMPEDLQYLQEGADVLLNGNFAQHTPPGIHHVEIPVCKQQSNNESGVLVLPDADGEQWLRLYRMREWSKEWEDATDNLTGVLVFVRVASEQNVAPLDWINAHHLFGQSVDLGGATSTPPTQVLLTDWIQMLLSATRTRQKVLVRVGIVITAWDLVPPDEQALSPRRYLARNYPMVEQYLRANRSRMDSEVFGTSVASGDFHDVAFREIYLAGDPVSAGYVVREQDGVAEKIDDVTLPVAWALGWDI